jgi:polysaccharide export outer membrane protein
VIEAIGIAKGFTKVAAKNSVKIMRMENGEKKTITVKVGDISRKGDKSLDVALKRGDIIYVPESLF